MPIALKSRLDQLTALRGIAATLVVFHHARTEWHPIFASGERMSMIVASSWLWVHFFFVLSGFVMMHAYGASFNDGVAMRDYVRFVIVRFGRIYPLYAVILVACVVAFHAGWLHFTDAPGSLLASIVLIQGFTFDRLVWNYPAWSISTEWYVYLAFPFLAAAFIRLRGPVFIGVATAIAGAIVFALFSIASEAAWWRLVFCLFEFALGMLVNLLVARRQIPLFSSGTAAFLVVLPAATLALPIPFSSPQLHGFVAVAFGLSIAIVTSQPTPLRGILHSDFLQCLGNTSYSIYLLHPLLFRSAAKIADLISGKEFIIATSPSAVAVALFAAYLGALFAASWVTYRFIEQPMRRWFKALAAGDRAA